MSGKRTSLFDQPMVFVDIETDGLNHIRGHVIEVAAIRVEGGKITKTFTSLVDPGIELPQFITRLTGITTNDVRGAPSFGQIADDLANILDGALFVAHNVRFDYSFLKQEFSRLGRQFTPRQLCTVRLSRALFPDQKGHKLQDLIRRYNFTYAARHRAYDDAAILWQFIQYVHTNVAVEIIEQAVAQQVRQPAIPKYIDQSLVKSLPTGPGVYIFEDEAGRPLYIGKSINIKKRVLQHFGGDHSDVKEFKIAQTVRSIRAESTDGELSALLLESQLVKELQPLYNRKLRRLNKLIAVMAQQNNDGYVTTVLQESDPEVALTNGQTLATYPRRGTAKSSLEMILRTHDLCPKLLGLEKASGACFWKQLGKCRGACIGQESADVYNARVQAAFAARRIESWPYAGPVLIRETEQTGIVVDDWCVIANVSQAEDCAPVVHSRPKVFDLDAYKILQSYLGHKVSSVRILPLGPQQLQELGV